MTATTPSTSSNAQTSLGRRFVGLAIAFVVVGLIVIAGSVLIAISIAGNQGLAATVEVVRNLFLTLLVLELLLIVTAFALLLIQIARFANLLQNEVRPILDSSTEAVNTIRGTTAFLSQQVVEPVMQVNAMMAGAREAFKLVQDMGHLRDIMTAAAQASQRGNGPAEPTDSKAN
jgi:hypothetical protein